MSATRYFLGLSIIRFAGVLVSLAIVPCALAQSAPAANALPAPTPTLAGPSTLPVYSEAEIKAGLWREGKAVATDVPFFDILLRLIRGPEWVRGYKPTQPINYNHQAHVERHGMECQYCHYGVAKSPYATMPSVELCMGCHKVIKQVAGKESDEIKKLIEYYEKGIPIEWVPVNNLPEHSQFNHERHLKAGVACQVCHGQVQKMPVVEKVSSLKMGFCVSCHRERGASVDCSTCHY